MLGSETHFELWRSGTLPAYRWGSGDTPVRRGCRTTRPSGPSRWSLAPAPLAACPEPACSSPSLRWRLFSNRINSKRQFQHNRHACLRHISKHAEKVAKRTMMIMTYEQKQEQNRALWRRMSQTEKIWFDLEKSNRVLHRNVIFSETKAHIPGVWYCFTKVWDSVELFYLSFPAACQPRCFFHGRYGQWCRNSWFCPQGTWTGRQHP